MPGTGTVTGISIFCGCLDMFCTVLITGGLGTDPAFKGTMPWLGIPD